MYIFNIKIFLKSGIDIICILLNVLDRLSIFGLKESTLINKYEDVQIAYTTAITLHRSSNFIVKKCNVPKFYFSKCSINT